MAPRLRSYQLPYKDHSQVGQDGEEKGNGSFLTSFTILTRTVFSEENVCPPPVGTDLIVEKGCFYNLSFYVCGLSMGAIFQNLRPSVTLKMGSRSPKSNQFLSRSQQYSCTSLVKINSFSGDRVQKSHFPTI